MNYKIEFSHFLPKKGFEGELLLEKGKMTYIEGINGIGKTTFLGRLKEESHYLLRMKSILIPQEPLAPISNLRVIDFFETLYEESKRDVKMEPNLYLKGYGVEESFASKKFKILSGGQKQLVKILLGFYFIGDVYLLDEPSQSLDLENKNKLIAIINKELKDDKAIIVVDHDHRLYQSLEYNHLEMKEADGMIRLEAYGI